MAIPTFAGDAFELVAGYQDGVLRAVIEFEEKG